MTAATRSAAERAWVAVLDGVQYAVALNGALVVLVGAPTTLLTGSLVGLKWFLFLVGLLLIGAGAWQLRPASPREGADGDPDGRRAGGWNSADPGGGRNPADDGGNTTPDERGGDGFGGRVGRLPPVAWYAPEPDERLSGGGRLLLAGALAWAVSFALERVLGVGVPAA